VTVNRHAGDRRRGAPQAVRAGGAAEQSKAWRGVAGGVWLSPSRRCLSAKMIAGISQTDMLGGAATLMITDPLHKKISGAFASHGYPTLFPVGVGLWEGSIAYLNIYGDVILAQRLLATIMGGAIYHHVTEGKPWNPSERSRSSQWPCTSPLPAAQISLSLPLPLSPLPPLATASALPSPRPKTPVPRANKCTAKGDGDSCIDILLKAYC